MPEIIVTVKHEVGLHARPAALFVKTAAQFKSDIKVTHGERRGNAKSILTVLTLAAHKGAEVNIQAEGEDAQEALTALKELVDDNFGENG